MSTYAFEFFNALFILIHMFETGKDPLREAILQYTGLYINRTVEHEEHSETILTTICSSVRQENYALIYTFLKALFDSPDVRWVPKPGLSHKMNPISLLLHASKTLPRAINLAQIVINHCIRIAKTENDWDFASPVLNSLHRLLKLQELPPDLVLSTFRGLAFIPEEERSHIINHAIIPRPFRLRRLFGNHNAKPIYAYKDPVLQIDDSPEFKEHDPLNENFTKDLFVASFDMLWRAPPKKPDARSPVERIRDRGPPHTLISSPSWICVLYYFIIFECRPRPHHRAEFYNLPLEALDNPAIVALTKFKWNTIGYKYWIVGFVWQSLFYSLVLFAVVAQVYLNDKRQSSSNYVDVVAYSLPLAGSICQILNIANNNKKGEVATLSFSVLFISLHFLYQLQINKNVCYFLRIINRTLERTRIFFVLFGTGILAFNVATLHLLHGCPVSECDDVDAEVKFPKQFFQALASTYFLMGGVWDPVSGDLVNDNWKFQIMMMLYYFFASVILLNILIGLVNEEFNYSHEAALFASLGYKLQFIERAENLTYNIPNYREAHSDIFPTKVYYFGTRKEQKEYRDKYSDKDTDDHHGSDIEARSSVTGTGPTQQLIRSATTTLKHGPDPGPSVAEARQARMTELKVIKQNQEEIKQEMQHMSQEMKKEIQHSHEQIRVLQEQLAGLTATLNRVLLLNDPSRQQ
ncbi:hypothetical protein BGX34_001672 [Mortierella sp. NVP85]|nr:hypothetical protein BGX34_001672 [Mortierella sp. NVP85]